jgi:hypothetical protein
MSTSSIQNPEKKAVRLNPTLTESALRACPRCECRHSAQDGPETSCRAAASFCVTVVCRAVGCDHAAAVYLLCAPCLDVWREEVAVDPGAAALRIRPL